MDSFYIFGWNCLTILAIIFRAVSYWGTLKDVFGLVGFILGLITIILIIVTFIIAAGVYVYVSNLTDETTGSSAPTLVWNIDSANYQLTITMCSPSGTRYADDSYTANIIFKTGGFEYYVGVDYNVISYGVANQEYIMAGDQIGGFIDGGTYTVVWYPNNEVLGVFTT